MLKLKDFANFAAIRRTKSGLDYLPSIHLVDGSFGTTGIVGLAAVTKLLVGRRPFVKKRT